MLFSTIYREICHCADGVIDVVIYIIYIGENLTYTQTDLDKTQDVVGNT